MAEPKTLAEARALVLSHHDECMKKLEEIHENYDKELDRSLKEARAGHDKEVNRLMELRQRDIDYILDKLNLPRIMVKVTPCTEDQRRKGVPRLEEFTYNPALIEFKGEREIKYECDAVLEQKTNTMIFNDPNIYRMVEGALTGRNCALIAYGATGSGKSTTFLKGPQGDKSLMHHAIDLVYRNKCTLALSCFEDYNGVASDISSDTSQELEVHVDDDGVHFRYKDKSELKAMPVLPDKQAALTDLDAAIKRRKTHKTVSNKTSSRSHAFFDLHVHNAAGVPQGRITFVDLAGKEELIGETNHQMKTESHYINNSLESLSNVIRHFATHKRGSSAKPFQDQVRGECRNHMLTKLLARTLDALPLPCIMLMGFVTEHGTDSKRNCSTLFFVNALMANIQKDKTIVTPGKSKKKQAESPQDGNFQKGYHAQKAENDRLRKLLKAKGIVVPSDIRPDYN